MSLHCNKPGAEQIANANNLESVSEQLSLSCKGTIISATTHRFNNDCKKSAGVT